MTPRRLLPLAAWLVLSALALRSAPRTNEYQPIGFDQLAAFAFATPEIDPQAPVEPQVAAIDEKIPWSVRKFDGMKVVITGFMLPVKVEDGLVREMLLMKDQSGCCYGQMPAMNEWIIVRIPSGVHAAMDQKIFLYGTIKVGTEVVDGYVSGIYHLDADHMKR